MSEETYGTIRKQEIATFAAQYFHVNLAVHYLLFDELSLSSSITMTVFSTADRNIYAFVESERPVSLGDIERLVKKAGFEPSRYAAPYARKNYFLEQAYAIFKTVYPGRDTWTTDEEAYYQLLVPYSPALIKLQGVRGPIRRYNRYGNIWEIFYQPAKKLVRAT